MRKGVCKMTQLPNILCVISQWSCGHENGGVADIRYFLKGMCYLLVFPFLFSIQRKLGSLPSEGCKLVECQ